jgi:DMSO/TMAO reductase YedYZ molybdopterin-dependent catalytic subunit
MNGQPLTPLHGFPVRLVVPRWYAVASVKWLTRIRLLAEPFEGHFQTEKYRYLGERGTQENSPIRTMRVRSLITAPSQGDLLSRATQEITGVAWSGDAPIAGVAVSVDGGTSWRSAELASPPSEYSWTAWRVAWTPASPGEHALLSRATDAAGNTQPMDQIWNVQGYGNNAVQHVRVRVD